MAYKGKTITNPKTGQQFRFIQTAKETGRLLEMESTFQPRCKEPAAHYHPAQEEEFTVLQGAITVRTNGAVTTLKQGDTLKVKARTIHAMWNKTDGKAVVNWKVRPALNTEYFFETGMGIAAHQKTDSLGMPSLLQKILLARQFSDVYRLAKPSYRIQKLLFTVLAPIAYLAGYRAVYKKYLD